MIAVIFEVVPREGLREDYLATAARLAPLLDGIDGFISIERFESLYEPGKILSLSFFRDEEAVARWRALEAHRAAQACVRRSRLQQVNAVDAARHDQDAAGVTGHALLAWLAR